MSSESWTRLIESGANLSTIVDTFWSGNPCPRELFPTLLRTAFDGDLRVAPVDERLLGETRDRISTELEVGLSDGARWTQDLAVLSRIALIISNLSMGQTFHEGCGQLTLRLLQILDDDDLVLQTLSVISKRLQTWWDGDVQELRIELLVIGSLLSRDCPDLVCHLNSEKFDIVDLLEVTSVWASSCMALSSLLEVTETAVCIVLLDSRVHLVGLVYGLLRLFESDIRLLRGESLFHFIASLPSRLQSDSFSEVVQIAYHYYRSPVGTIATLRASKDWERCMAIPGTVLFSEDVGTAAATAAHAARQQTVTRPPVVPEAPKPSPPVSAREETFSASNDIDTLLQKTRSLKLSSVAAQLAAARENAANAAAAAAAATQEQTPSPLLTDEEYAAGEGEAGMDDDMSTARSGGERKSGEKTMHLQQAVMLLHPSDSTTEKKMPPSSGLIRFSELMDYQSVPCLYMEGYLMKSRSPSRLFRRRNTSGFFGNLHRRFFVLQGNFLTYFKSHLYKKPSKDVSVDMRGRVVVPLPNHDLGAHGFQINTYTGECMYMLFAASAEMKDLWVRVLHAASRDF